MFKTPSVRHIKYTSTKLALIFIINRRQLFVLLQSNLLDTVCYRFVTISQSSVHCPIICVNIGIMNETTTIAQYFQIMPTYSHNIQQIS